MWRLFLALCLGTIIGCSSDEATDNNQNVDPSTDTPVDSPTDTPTDNPADDSVAQPGEHVFVVPVSNAEATWHDMAFLAAIPTSSKLNGARPLVIASETPAAMPLPTRDFIRRLSPQNVYVLGDDRTNNMEGVGTVHGMAQENASDYSAALVAEHWERSNYLVVSDEADYAGSVLAASLASKIEAPLVFGGVAADTLDALVDNLGVESIVWVSSTGASSPVARDNVTLLGSVEAALQWTKANAMEVDYIALTNVSDRLTGKNQKLSLTAAMYASRRGGLALPVSLDIPAQVMTIETGTPVLDELENWYAVLERHPTYLALVGAFDALPQTRQNSIFDNPVAEHPVSDLPYGEVDSDPFSDIALGRIVSDTINEGSVLASRNAAYELLFDGVWEKKFIESGLWGFDELRPLMLNVGFDTPEHPSESVIKATEFFEVSAILHKDHSNCVVLGNAFDTSVQALYAPAVVTSRGCSVGGMDLVASSQRTIVEHMLGRGAVAFLGATRNSIAENTLIEVSFWNRILAGETLGEAFRGGINDMMVHWIDDNYSSGVRYSIDIEILYGDPALSYQAPAEPLVSPASAELVGDTVTVQGPADWTLVQFLPEQLEEWNYQEDLFMYVGPGAIPRTYWSGSHDSEDLYYGVNIDVPAPVSGIQEQTAVVNPLGWSGGYHTDSHQDGTHTLRWRVRLLDYDMATGEIYSQMDELTYGLVR